MMQEPVEVPIDRSQVSAHRRAEINDVIGHVTRWVAGRTDVVGLLLVGSVARDAARPDSDIDLVLLVTSPDQYSDNTWTTELGLGEPVRTRSWGAVTERRFLTASGLEVELNVGSADWARTDPVDAGTRRVVTYGARTLYDPAGILGGLLDACRPG